MSGAEKGKTMKRLLVSIASAVLLASSMFTMSAFAGDEYFNLRNRTGGVMVGLYVSPTENTRWTDDLMAGNPPLYPGEDAEVAIQDGRVYCDYDIRVEFNDGSIHEEFDFDVCNDPTLTIYD